MNNFQRNDLDIKGFLAISALSFIVSLCIMLPLNKGGLWIIDDHEIIGFELLFRNMGGLSLDSFISALAQTELSPSGMEGRYRPVYYALRVLKSAWFGGEARLWFGLNAALVFFALTAVGCCLRRYFRWFWVINGVIALSVLPFHGALWGRLGPSEIDSFLWCSLVLLGAVWHDGKCRWAWPLFCVAVALSIGSKENFILLFIPLIWLLWRDRQRQILTLSQFIWLLLPVVVAIPVAAVLLKSIFIVGTDIYGVSTGKGAVWSLLLFLSTSFGAYFGYTVLVVLLVARHYQRQDKNIFDTSIQAFIVIILMAMGSYVFYRGNVGGINRYGFPYDALILLGFFVALFPLQSFLGQFFCRYDRGVCFIRPLLLTVYLGVALLALVSFTRNMIQISSQIRGTESFADFRELAQKGDAVGVMMAESRQLHSEEVISLQMYNRGGYIPQVFSISLFEEEETAHCVKPNIQPLAPNVLLIEFGPDNKKYYLRNFWSRLPFIVSARANPHWFRPIEHTQAVRPMAAVLADRSFLPLNDRGEAVFQEKTTLYVPVDDPKPGTLVLQMSGSIPVEHGWKFSANGQAVEARVMSHGVEIPISGELWAAAPHHPQILELSMKPTNVLGQPPLSLKLLALVLNDSPS